MEGAPDAVHWLVALGAHFDAGPDGEILLGREAAHRDAACCMPGDATGAEIERALVARVREDRNVDIYPGRLSSISSSRTVVVAVCWPSWSRADHQR